KSPRQAGRALMSAGVHAFLGADVRVSIRLSAVVCQTSFALLDVLNFCSATTKSGTPCRAAMNGPECTQLGHRADADRQLNPALELEARVARDSRKGYK